MAEQESAANGAWIRSQAFDEKYAFAGALGPQYTPESTQFRLWAPTVQSVTLNTYTSDRSEDAPLAATYEMTRGTAKGEQGVWFATLAGDQRDTAYDFLLTFADGSQNRSADPYATAATVNGDRSVVLAPSQTQIDDFDRLPAFAGGPTAAVIGETDIRDLTISPTSGVPADKRGTYCGVIEPGTHNAAGLPTGLEYLRTCGITHVQFQPMFQFSSIDETKPRTDQQYNWGYDPKNYNVPEGWYASDPFTPAVRIVEMKKMIRGLHQAGLRVCMDVVYNHVYDAAQHVFGLTVPGYFFRYNADGTLTNGSACGNDVASERAMVRKYIVDSITYWAKNFHLDGFRFDLMGLLDQETMRQVRQACDAIDPSILVYGEGWSMAQGIDPVLVSDQTHADRLPRIGFFNDATRDDTKGNVFYAHSRGFVSGAHNATAMAHDMLACPPTMANIVLPADRKPYVAPDQVVQYVEAHDNRTLYDTLAISMFDRDFASKHAQVSATDSMLTASDAGSGLSNGTGSDSDSGDNSDTPVALPPLSDVDENVLMRAVRCANAIVALSQGMPFFQIGQAFGRTKNGDGNSFVSGDAVNAVNWDWETKNRESDDYTRALLQIRRAFPALHLSTYEQIRRHVTATALNEDCVVMRVTASAPHEGEKAGSGVNTTASATADTSSLISAREMIIVVNAGTKPVMSAPASDAGTYQVLAYGDRALEPQKVTAQMSITEQGECLLQSGESTLKTSALAQAGTVTMLVR